MRFEFFISRYFHDIQGEVYRVHNTTRFCIEPMNTMSELPNSNENNKSIYSISFCVLVLIGISVGSLKKCLTILLFQIKIAKLKSSVLHDLKNLKVCVRKIENQLTLHTKKINADA